MQAVSQNNISPALLKERNEPKICKSSSDVIKKLEIPKDFLKDQNQKSDDYVVNVRTY